MFAEKNRCPIKPVARGKYGFTALTLKRSILTEKVARRGYHLSREYAVDPLEILFVREVAQTNFVALSADALVRNLEKRIQDGDRPRGQYLFPITDKDGLRHRYGIAS